MDGLSRWIKVVAIGGVRPACDPQKRAAKHEKAAVHARSANARFVPQSGHIWIFAQRPLSR